MWLISLEENLEGGRKVCIHSKPLFVSYDGKRTSSSISCIYRFKYSFPLLKILLIPVTAAVMTVAAVFSVSLDCDGIGCGAGK